MPLEQMGYGENISGNKYFVVSEHFLQNRLFPLLFLPKPFVPKNTFSPFIHRTTYPLNKCPLEEILGVEYSLKTLNIYYVIGVLRIKIQNRPVCEYENSTHILRRQLKNAIMFSLAKLSYYACNDLEKKWYYTVPKNVIDIDVRDCCELLLGLRSNKSYPSALYELTRPFELCTIASKHGHLDCLIYAHNLEFKWNTETCNNAAINGHFDMLVYAHEHGCQWNIKTCERAAKYGHLDILKYAHEHGCPWDQNTCSSAASSGHLAILKYAREHGCPWDVNTCTFAAKHGHVNILKYAHEQGCPWAENTYELAAENGHLNIINYAYDHGFPLDVKVRDLAASNGHLDVLIFAKEHGYPWDVSTCSLAASNGHLKILKYAHEHGCPWDVNTCILAASNGHLDTLKYAHEHGCPWDVVICKLALKNKHFDVLKYVRKCGLRTPTVFAKGWGQFVQEADAARKLYYESIQQPDPEDYEPDPEDYERDFDSTLTASNGKRQTTYLLEIRNLVQQQRRARRICHNTRHPTDKTEWNRKATRHIKRPRVQVSSIRKEDGTRARSEQEKTEIYAQNLERVFLPHDIDSELDIVQCQQLSVTREKIKHFTPLEVASVIDDNLNPQKEPGYEEINPKILQELPKKAIIHLTYIYNDILRWEYIPEQLKRAQVIMLLNPGKSPEDVTSYRPISLFPSLSKLLEKLLLKRLKLIIEGKHLIPDHQFVFRNKHSTIDQIHRVTNVMSKALKELLLWSVP
ncbi:Ankyrin repeat-containing domain,Reverse transcriptase domain [Cinara cedri]|uniref:Ankyrin repeat-containing domain,Reverse transcriptase domain n=1 Tax=Cinara cedri TaxID=506608 RepID=A0A5E4N6Y7_9HEMI|nr:Ankyrin repeat-containing domain,Reverse transcriptase domain [Cinara cedri]